MEGCVLAGTNNLFTVECSDNVVRNCTIKGKVLKSEKEFYNPIAPGDVVQIEKKYFVKLKDKVCKKDKLDYCEKCKNGLLLKEDKKSPSFTTRPTVIEWKTDYECFITLTEGKFHEVRRIFETLGNCVIILKRISFYNYDLGTLKEGKIKKL